MFPLYSQQLMNDREREIRRGAEAERRLRAERTRDDPYGMDAEIRVLLERTADVSCDDCTEELTRAAG